MLLLRYEEFVYDFQVIFNGIEGFFEIKIPLETRNVLTERYQIEAVEKIVARMSTFAEYDTRTLWHGKHISKYKGAPFYYKTFFQDDQIAYLEGVYNKFLLEFNYL